MNEEGMEKGMDAKKAAFWTFSAGAVNAEKKGFSCASLSGGLLRGHATWERARWRHGNTQQLP